MNCLLPMLAAVLLQQSTSGYVGDLTAAAGRADVVTVRRIVSTLPKGKDALKDHPHALTWAVFHDDHPKERVEILKLLLSTGVDVSNERDVLGQAIQHGTPDLVRILLEAGVVIEPPQKPGDIFYGTVLYHAVKLDKVEDLELLLKHGASPTLACSRRGVVPKRPEQTFQPVFPIHLAAFNGSQKCLKVLIRAGANVNFRNLKGETPLHSAILGNQGEWMLDILLKLGANRRTKTNKLIPWDKRLKVVPAETAEELALRKGKPELARFIRNWTRGE